MLFLDFGNTVFLIAGFLAGGLRVEDCESDGRLECCSVVRSRSLADETRKGAWERTGEKKSHLSLTVPDFATIPLEFLDIVVLLDVRFRFVLVADLRTSTLVVFFQLSEEILPDLLAGVVVERVVADGDVDARHERLIEMPYTVGGKEQNPLEVIHCAQKYWKERIHVSDLWQVGFGGSSY